MHNREEIARRYGFDTFAELLDVSKPLPTTAGDNAQSYVARHRNGRWFIWEDAPPAKAPDPGDKGRAQACDGSV